MLPIALMPRSGSSSFRKHTKSSAIPSKEQLSTASGRMVCEGQAALATMTKTSAWPDLGRLLALEASAMAAQVSVLSSRAPAQMESGILRRGRTVTLPLSVCSDVAILSTSSAISSAIGRTYLQTMRLASAISAHQCEVPRRRKRMSCSGLSGFRRRRQRRSSSVACVSSSQTWMTMQHYVLRSRHQGHMRSRKNHKQCQLL
mmetsp:Transcript_1389/g.3252  ORF Transcript_1389/g.3252 Transcript_1389/m.3252 type:complete len:202 (-) Transcript_1389:70-675(-)